MAGSPSPRPLTDTDPDSNIVARRRIEPKTSRSTDGPITGGPKPPSPPTAPNDREKLIHNEQAKLTATITNGVALAFIVGSGVNITANLPGNLTVDEQAARTLVWVVSGAILHLIARLVLRRLQ